MTARGGVVLRLDGGALQYLPANVAVGIVHLPPVTRVAGAPEELLGIALHEGSIVPVLTIGAARDRMVVCAWMGELLGVVGGTVERTGSFEVDPERPELVRVGDATARPLDLATLYARVQAGGWVARWGG